MRGDVTGVDEDGTTTVLLDGVVPIRHTLRADSSTIEASASPRGKAADVAAASAPSAVSRKTLSKRPSGRHRSLEWLTLHAAGAIPLTTKPMEAEPVDDLPRGKDWLYEPKYEGFRCLAFRDGDRVDLRSKNQKSLNRFFPEVAHGAVLKADRFVLDGELVIRARPSKPCSYVFIRWRAVSRNCREISGTTGVFDLLARNRQANRSPSGEKH